MDELEKYVSMPYAVEVVPDRSTDGSLCYLARHPELPGCMSHGETPDEAISSLSDARRLYIKILIGKKQEIPLPKSVHQVRWTVIDVHYEPSARTLSEHPMTVNPIRSL